MSEEQKQQYFLSNVEIPKSKLVLSRTVRLMVFIVFVFLSVVVDLDNGVIASSSQVVKRDLEMNDSEYGLFASIPFTGRIIGLLIFMALIGADHRKLLAVGTITLHGSSFFIYLFTKNKLILYGTRFFTSIMKVFCSIYMPVWIDQFGLRHHKTIMMTLAYMLSPYGHIIGFTIGTLVFPEKWTYALSFIGGLMFFFAFIFVIIPAKYFSSRYLYVGYEEGREKLVLAKPIKMKTSIFAEGDTIHKKDNPDKAKINPYNIFMLFTSGSYVFCALTRANLFSIFQIIHLFIKDYFINGLQVQNQEQILYYYGLCSLIGPPVGSFIGGFISNKLGGYESRSSVLLCVVFGLFACLLVIPLSFCTQIETFSLSLLCFFFCTSGLLPTLTGYTISSAPKELKGAATSVDMLMTTLIGKMPGPIVYGMLNDKYKAVNPRFAWQCGLFYYYVGFTCMMIACCCRWVTLSRISKEDSGTTPGAESGPKQVKLMRRVSSYVTEIVSGDQKDLMEQLKSTPADSESVSPGGFELNDKKSYDRLR